MSDHLYDELKALRETLQREREQHKAQVDNCLAGVAAMLLIIQQAPPTLAASMLAQIPKEVLAVGHKLRERDDLKQMVIDLLDSRDAGCGCDAHPPAACEWHGPIIRARAMLANLQD